MFDAQLAGTLTVVGVIVVGSETFTVTISDGKLAIRRGQFEPAQFTLFAPDAMTIAALVYGKVSFAQLDPLKVQGSEAAMQSFVDLFHLPKKLD
jgi:hypothetical protein